MRKIVLFTLLLFATCLASAAILQTEDLSVRHEIAINDNYTQVVAVTEMQVPCVAFASVSACQLVPEVTIVTYYCNDILFSSKFQNTEQILSNNKLDFKLQSVVVLKSPDRQTNVRLYILNKQLALK